MQNSYEAAVIVNSKGAAPEAIRNALLMQHLPPHTVNICPETERDGGYGPGSLLTEAIRGAASEYLLILDSRAVPASEHFSEMLIRCLLEDPDLSAVYACMYAEKSARSLNKAMDAAWLTEKENFSLGDFYELGPEVFMMPMAACMLRVADVRDYFIEPSGLSRPEYELNAHLLYDGKKIAKAKDAAVDYAPGMSFVRCFREAFLYGAALKLYYTSFGLSWKNTALKMSNGIIKHARRTMKRSLKAGAFWNVPAILFRMLAALLGDFLGENYHRLPLRLDRLLSADPYFS